MNKLYWLLRRTLLIEYSYKMNNFLSLANIFFYTLIFYFISGLVNKAGLPVFKQYGGSYFPFVLLGLAVNSYYSTARSTFAGNLRSEQLLGTMEPLLATGTPLIKILSGLALFDFFMDTLEIVVIFCIVVFFLGIHFVWINIFSALIILILSILAFAGFGLISAALVLIFKRGDPLGWVVGNLSALAGGIYYPTEILPLWLQNLANILPITHSLRAIRLILLKGASLYDLRYEVLALMLFAAILLPISILFFRFALRKVTTDGTLATY